MRPKENIKVKSKSPETVKKINIKVIGIGNGGSSITAEIAPLVSRAKFLAFNTDRLALSKLPEKVESFHFGQNLTGGLGTGMNTELAEKAAREESEKIRKALKDTDFYIFISCLGGGTGSGATPVFAEIAKKMGGTSYGIFTLPFNFEGERKMEMAKESLKKLSSSLNALSIVPNERIFYMVDKKLPLKKALSGINGELAFSLGGLIELIYDPGLINIDFADLKTILKGRGFLTYLSKVESQAKEGAEKLLQRAISNLLYPYNVSQAKRVLFNVFGPSDLALAEVMKISQGVFDSVKKNAKIIFGVSQKTSQKKTGISLLAVGCEMKGFSLREKRRPRQRLKKKILKDIPEAKKFALPLKESKKEQEEKIKESKKKPRKKVQEKTREKKEVRKNALQVKKDVEELEKEIQKAEEIWETPAVWRKEGKI